LAKSIIFKKPLWTEERLLIVRRLVEEQPDATLRKLCEQLQQKQGLYVSSSSLSRAQKRLGLTRRVQNSRLAAYRSDGAPP